MARKLKFDRLLFLTTLVLVAVSIVMVYSASNLMGAGESVGSNIFLMKQTLFAAIGLMAMFVTMRIDYEHYRDPHLILGLVGVTLLALVAVLFVGPEINGTHRWFAVAGIGIQPSELAKLALVLFTAAVLERRMERISDPMYALGPILAVLVPMLILIMRQPDFGSSVVMLAIVAVMVFAAGLPWRYILSAALGIVPVVAAAAVFSEYRVRRLTAFLDPWADREDSGYQLVQSLIAVGSGGLTGNGLGYSVQKLGYLPYPHTDFIYAIVSEELGLAGASVLLVCFCLITWRGLKTASRAPDAFGSLLALGLTAMIAVQAFVNISVVLGLLPTKGLPLPFVSAGGSSLIMSLAGMGVLLNISQRASATT
ncbi:MAG: ftsW 2 [Acidobacteria bacterium]|nr:ftsW 2 [Acidobacteriota bacterium]